MYGKSLQRNLNQSFTGSQIVENPELLHTIEEMNDNNLSNCIKIDIPKPAFLQEPKLDSPKPATVLVPANKQIETRLPDGKRRITPMFLKPAPSLPNKYAKNTF